MTLRPEPDLLATRPPAGCQVWRYVPATTVTGLLLAALTTGPAYAAVPAPGGVADSGIAALAGSVSGAPGAAALFGAGGAPALTAKPKPSAADGDDKDRQADTPRAGSASTADGGAVADRQRRGARQSQVDDPTPAPAPQSAATAAETPRLSPAVQARSKPAVTQRKAPAWVRPPAGSAPVAQGARVARRERNATRTRPAVPASRRVTPAAGPLAVAPPAPARPAAVRPAPPRPALTVAGQGAAPLAIQRKGQPAAAERPVRTIAPAAESRRENRATAGQAVPRAASGPVTGVADFSPTGFYQPYSYSSDLIRTLYAGAAGLGLLGLALLSLRRGIPAPVQRTANR